MAVRTTVRILNGDLQGVGGPVEIRDSLDAVIDTAESFEAAYLKLDVIAINNGALHTSHTVNIDNTAQYKYVKPDELSTVHYSIKVIGA